MELPTPEQRGITVFSINNCINCEKLKGFLIGNHKEYKVIRCDKYYDSEDTKLILREHLYKLTGKKTNSYPMVFLNGVYFGGYIDVLDYYEDF